MLHHLRVKLGDGITVCVAIVDDSVKFVELADLVLSVNTREVFSSHEMLTEDASIESYLCCSSWRHTHHIRTVVDSAENLEHALLCLVCDLVFLSID